MNFTMVKSLSAHPRFPINLHHQPGTGYAPLLLIQLASNAAVVKGWGLIEAQNGVLAALLKLLCLVVVKVGELDNGRSQQEQEYRRQEAQRDGEQQLKRREIRS